MAHVSSRVTFILSKVRWKLKGLILPFESLDKGLKRQSCLTFKLSLNFQKLTFKLSPNFQKVNFGNVDESLKAWPDLQNFAKLSKVNFLKFVESLKSRASPVGVEFRKSGAGFTRLTRPDVQTVRSNFRTFSKRSKVDFLVSEQRLRKSGKYTHRLQTPVACKLP